jgi:hypothetical protein
VSVLSLKRSTHAPTPVTPGRWHTFVPVARCYLSIGTNPAGDATLDVRSAELQAGKTYQFFVPVGSPPFIDGLSPRPAADVTPEDVTYVDVGASPILTAMTLKVDE